MPSEKYAASIDVIRHLTEVLEKQLAIPVLHTPDKFVFPLTDFFDSYYHLTKTAGQYRSQFIGDAIQQLRKGDRSR